MLYKVLYTDRCFVDEDVMQNHGATMLRGSFLKERKEEVVVHVPTKVFFVMHNIDPTNQELWSHMNLKGFFELPAWGPNFMRSYQALNS